MTLRPPRDANRFGRVLASAAILGGVVLATTSSNGQPALSSEQVAAREVFDEQIKEALDKAKDKCGADFRFVADFQGYSESEWKMRFGKRPRLFTAAPCFEALTAAAAVCGGAEPAQGKEKRRPAAEAEQAEGAKAPGAVKGVTCTFSGASPKKDAGEDTEVHLRRNASFAGGELTVRIPADYSNVSSGIYADVIRGIAKSSSLASGAACKQDGECRTGLCEAGTCQTCSKKLKCRGRSELCGDDGGCYTPLPPNHGRSSAPAGGQGGGSKKSGKGLGQSCKSTSECESGRTCTQRTPKIRTCQ